MKKITLMATMLAVACQISYAQCGNHCSKANDGRSLKEAYKDYFSIGVAVNQRNISNPEQAALVLKEYNSITAENDMKPVSVHPKAEVWTWEKADSVADFCRKNGIKMRGHNLLWHNQMCNWMFYDSEGHLVTKEVLFQRMREHIHTVVNRYKDITYCWDVFNEAIKDGPLPTDGTADQPLRESKFWEICHSDEYIRKAFEYAREAAGTDILLFYNDYNECDSVKRERIYKMVKEMRQDGVPIDGIGMQGHYNIYGPSAAEIEAAIERYAEIVDHLHVTELDIRVNEEMGGQLRFSRNEGVQISDEMKQRQEVSYDTLFTILRRHSDKVENVTFWNLSDADSWLGVNNYPLLFDRDLKPKNVYRIVRDFQHTACQGQCKRHKQ